MSKRRSQAGVWFDSEWLCLTQLVPVHESSFSMAEIVPLLLQELWFFKLFYNFRLNGKKKTKQKTQTGIEITSGVLIEIFKTPCFTLYLHIFKNSLLPSSLP